MRDVIVIGAGIMGSTIAKALAKEGRAVLLLDNNQAMAGTRPSGGHIKPSWAGGMKTADYDSAMTLLESVWDVTQEEFAIKVLGKPLVKTTIWRVDTDVVLTTPKVIAEVTSISLTDTNAPLVAYTEGPAKKEERCRLLVVAAGTWCNALLPEVFPDKTLVAKQGVSFRFPGKVEPFIQPWAPYKQTVAHQQGPDEIWIGDGSAIKPENWDDQLITQRALSRCRAALVSQAQPRRIITGLRPYCSLAGPKDPCFLRKVGKATWVATGAGKLGTISAGWAADRIIRG